MIANAESLRLPGELVTSYPDDRFERRIFAEAINRAPEHEDRSLAYQAGWEAVHTYRRESRSRARP